MPERSIRWSEAGYEPPLPRLTARENVMLAAGQRPGTSAVQQRGRADHYLALLGIAGAADQLPGQLSLGTQQCVSLARALSLEPRFLLLDEPFSQLDSLTRFELQDTLLQVWEETDKTVVMVTHDVDEGLYLADRLILMTDGPEATVGGSLTVPFPRPRRRAPVLAHPDYHQCRRRVIDFLEHHAHANAEALRDQLLGAGRSPDTPAAVIEWGTCARQRVVVGTIATLPDVIARVRVQAPAVIVIGETVRLRPVLDWVDAAALFPSLHT